MGYHLALEREEIPTYTTAWMNLEDIMVSEISQSQKDKYFLILLMWGSWSSQIHKDKKVEWWLPGTRGRGEQEIII